jgi:hypothetical protein
VITIYLTARDYRSLMWDLAQAWGEHSVVRLRRTYGLIALMAPSAGVETPPPTN